MSKDNNNIYFILAFICGVAIGMIAGMLTFL